jgi:hypothetical protein
MTRTPNFYAQPTEFVGTTVVEIAVLSGKLIAADNLGSTPYFYVESTRSINYGAGLDAWTKQHAAQAQVAQAFVGNSCPSITMQPDGSLVIVSLDYEADDEDIPLVGEKVLANGEVRVASICTDLWSVMLADYDHWLSRGGPTVDVANEPYGLEKFWVIDVTPGLYRWTVFSNSDDFSLDREGRIEYAKLELVQAY